jgi:hypothetical protein
LQLRAFLDRSAGFDRKALGQVRADLCAAVRRIRFQVADWPERRAISEAGIKVRPPILMSLINLWAPAINPVRPCHPTRSHAERGPKVGKKKQSHQKTVTFPRFIKMAGGEGGTPSLRRKKPGKPGLLV